MSSSYAERLHRVIPGGAHTYSRGDDQFPENAPAILERGNGCFVWSPDGSKFIDYGMGLRSVCLGYGHEEVAAAAYAEILKGNNLTRASTTELYAAELLSDLIPSAEMVKFAKHGSTVTSAAIKLARAYTGRKLVAVPSQHPFFSFDDWFIGSTVMHRGVPDDIQRLTLKFDYNNIGSLRKLFDDFPGQIAAVIMEAATTQSPCPPGQEHNGPCTDQPGNHSNFLHEVRALCTHQKALFILDEMITGFRWHFRGAQHFYNVTPDLSTFGKAMANGFAVAALTGKREIMQLGGIREEGAERVFLTSTTHGAEMSALGAFMKTVDILKRDSVVDHFWKFGKALTDGLNSCAKELGIQNHFYTEGYACSPAIIMKDATGQISAPFRTLFLQEMIKGGVMMPYLAICQAHTNAILDQTLDAASTALKIYAQALDKGVDKYLHSKIVKPVFRKFN